MCLQADTCLVSAICTRGINYRGQECGLLTCYLDTDLAIAKQIMVAKGIKQLPVIKRGGDLKGERKLKIIAILHYESIKESIRCCFSICYLPDVSYRVFSHVIQHFKIGFITLNTPVIWLSFRYIPCILKSNTYTHYTMKIIRLHLVLKNKGLSETKSYYRGI